MFCRNVDSFPVRQIPGTRYVLVCSTSHTEIHEKFRHDFYYKNGQIENLKFAGTEMNQHSSKT